MQSILSCGSGLLLAAVVSVPAAAQSINVDFGDPGHRPPASYAGAGQAGFWNSIPALHNTTTAGLRDLDGQATSLDVFQIGGSATVITADPATSGDDELLMDDYLVTFNPNLESCLFFHNFEPGTYEVIIYARMPAAAAVMSYTNVDEEAGNPHHEVGGVWPGGHAEFVTYSRHIAEVGLNGLLRAHSGIAPGANPGLGAALNGIQIRQVVACDEDVTGDFTVNVDDLVAVITAWGTTDAAADIDGSGLVDVNDLVAVITAWGACG